MGTIDRADLHRQIDELAPEIFDVVERSADVMGGLPVFRGTRVPARALVDYLAAGDSLDTFLDDFPSVCREQATALLERMPNTEWAALVSLAVAESPPAAVSLFVPTDTSDAQLVDVWLHGKSPHTQRAYRTDAERFLTFVARPLRMVTLVDLQDYADSLDGAPATRIRALAAVKSLLTFGQRTGFLVLNVGAALKLPPRKDTLAERILDEAEVHTLLAREPGHRNRVLLRLLYRAGLRVSEIAGLCWRDTHARDDGGQVTVFGEGGKTRTVLLPADVWRDLVSLRGTAGLDDPVFRSRNGHHLDPSAIFRIVRRAAERAELQAGSNVSPHWLRHAHATHALERGAPIHLVQATLGHASVATTGRYLHARPTDSSARYTSG